MSDEVAFSNPHGEDFPRKLARILRAFATQQTTPLGDALARADWDLDEALEQAGYANVIDGVDDNWLPAVLTSAADLVETIQVKSSDVPMDARMALTLATENARQAPDVLHGVALSYQIELGLPRLPEQILQRRLALVGLLMVQAVLEGSFK